MKRILTLALLASAASFPVHAAGLSTTGGAASSTGAGVHVGADTGVGAETNIRGNTNIDLNAGTRPQDDTPPDQNREPSASTLPSGSTSATSTNSAASSGAVTNGSSLNGETLNNNDVKLIQQSLRQEGYFNGVADGRWGPKTATALQQYQQKNRLSATGNLDSQTLNKLGVTIGTGAQMNNGSGNGY